MQAPTKLAPLFDHPKTHNILEGGRGGAKSMSSAGLIAVIMEQLPLWTLCGRETQKSLRDSSYAELESAIRQNCDPANFRFKPSDSMITSRVGVRAVFNGLQQHTVDSIKSYKGFHWVWIEESQAISKKSLNTVIPTPRTDGWFQVDLGDGKMRKFPLRMFLYTMNPFEWTDPINFVLPATRDDVQRIRINYWDNPWFPESLEDERVQAKKTLSDEEYLRIWEGIPFEDTERSVISRAKIEAAMHRQASRDGGEVVGLDVARFGTDRSVIYKREGMQVITEKILSKKDTQEVARVGAEIAAGCKMNVDDTGVGGGVTDKLNELKANVVPINFGGRARNKKKYPDIISEMWFNLGDIIDEIGLPYDEELLQELASRHFKYTADERRKVESKEDYKKRTGRRSPDKADALILCYYNRGGVMSVNTL